MHFGERTRQIAHPLQREVAAGPRTVVDDHRATFGRRGIYSARSAVIGSILGLGGMNCRLLPEMGFAVNKPKMEPLPEKSSSYLGSI